MSDKELEILKIAFDITKAETGRHYTLENVLGTYTGLITGIRQIQQAQELLRHS